MGLLTQWLVGSLTGRWRYGHWEKQWVVIEACCSWELGHTWILGQLEQVRMFSLRAPAGACAANRLTSVLPSPECENSDGLCKPLLQPSLCYIAIEVQGNKNTWQTGKLSHSLRGQSQGDGFSFSSISSLAEGRNRRKVMVLYNLGGTLADCLIQIH